ncbi:hypothetical protein CI109_104761 [Kwoniella shandongensis]|uniref:Transcription initiation factor TFIID subunit 2 n=1 Tax=Kwoniella shandongensis TaxID=1734106 RepID=A0A5M6BPK5_9TREE|nr:uncharacterized protein CI109_007000 [Kwoniella shandongensis]KAA5524677.1 hypothetical protein CI109_007000 [Kwoniella shandongensis]
MAEDTLGSARGFSLSHQRNVLEIDFAGVITASAFLTIQPNNPALRILSLHASPLLQINNVTLSSPTATEPLLPTPVSFTLSNPFQPLPTREPPIDIKSHPEIKRKTWAATGERDEGELAISVSGGWVRLIESQAGGGQGATQVGFAPIHVQIDYQLVLGGSVVEGIVFRRPGDGGDEYQIPHMFLSPTTYDAARIWTPCVDSLWERCTWELEFIVPRYLEGGDPAQDDAACPVMVVSSGELMEQITHPHDPHKVIFYYLQTNPTSVQHISFAAGPFEMHCVSADESHKPILAFCLPGDLEMLKYSTSFLPRAMAFGTEMGSYPFTDFKAVFVNNPRTECSTSATLAIASSDLLHPPNIIEQAMEIRQVLSLALIQQWIGINIIQRTFADTWIINGLALYIQGQFIRHLLGNNEYRFRLKRDIDRCVQQDQGSQWPLCIPGMLDPPDAATTAFINLKAPLVLHILDRHLAKTGTSLGLSQVIPRIFVAALSDDLAGNTLTTQYFLRQCRKVSGLDLQTFQDQWIFGSGCPRLTIRTNFIKKKFLVEFTVIQSQPASEAINGLSEKQRKVAIWKRPTQFFEGSLTVRIHEADGAPFEHLVDVKTNQRTFPLPFNTKYKRTRRSGHIAARFNKMQDAINNEDDEDEAQLQAADRASTFAYPPWEDEAERKRWKVAEWGEEQADQVMSEGGGYEWIRIDPDCEWLAAVEFAEKPWCWISQLQGDRDVIAQLEAINRMRVYPTPVVASELARTVLVKNYYYRVRMEAARALAAYNISECDYIGYFLVMRLFQTLYCQKPADPDVDVPDLDCRPLPNDFSNFPDYFVKKSLLAAMADLRDPATRTVWRNVRVALLDILRLNDNAGNHWSDSYYVAALVTAIGNAFTMGAGNQGALDETEREGEQTLLKEATEAIDKAMTMDRLVPSYHNVVTKAGLETNIKSILASQRTNDMRLLLSYTREGNFEPIRMAALDGMMLCKPPGRSAALDHYLLEVIRTDFSLTIRRHVARSLSESILITLAVGDIPGAIPQPAIMDVTNDTDQAKEQRAEKHNNDIVKALRKDYGKKVDFKQMVQDSLIECFTMPDPEVRLALLKVAEIIASSTSEPLPGNLITLQTPTVETPALMTPKIRLSMGSADIRPDSQGYGFPIMESPATAVAPIPTKIVLKPTPVAAPTPKKKDKVPKQQRRGLSDNDFKAITIALGKLLQHKSSFFFRQPVDPVRDAAPDYLTIITQPMDLSTIRAKLDNGMYATRQEFVADIRLIIANCYKYNNAPTSPVRKAGEAFERIFDGIWTKTEHTLNSSAASAQRAMAAQTLEPIPVVMPPPPQPAEFVASVPKPTAVKFKVKPPKSVTIDTNVYVPPMAPPPIPAGRKTAPQPSPDRPPVPTFTAPAPSEKSSKKRKSPVKGNRNDLDDLLGAEIDAIEGRPVAKAFEELLEPQAKPSKKIKLAPPSRRSPEKTSDSRGSSSTPGLASAPVDVKPVIKPILNPVVKKAKSKTPGETVSSSPAPQQRASQPPSQEVAANSVPVVAFPTRPQPPRDLPPTSQNTGAIRTKRARAMLALLQKEPAAIIFLRPVDPVLDGCPTYLDEIKHPMDFGTIGKKLDQKKYRTLGQFARDVELVFANCRQFNPPGEITACADAVEAVYWREWPKVTTSKMTSDEKKAMVSLLVTALKNPLSEWFRLPVDPVALGIPQYFDIIPQEDARDLSLIKNKMDKGQYQSAKQVDEDVELMLENARVFNGEGPVVDAANALGKWWQGQRSKME